MNSSTVSIDSNSRFLWTVSSNFNLILDGVQLGLTVCAQGIDAGNVTCVANVQVATGKIYQRLWLNFSQLCWCSRVWDLSIANFLIWYVGSIIVMSEVDLCRACSHLACSNLNFCLGYPCPLEVQLWHLGRSYCSLQTCVPLDTSTYVCARLMVCIHRIAHWIVVNREFCAHPFQKSMLLLAASESVERRRPLVHAPILSNQSCLLTKQSATPVRKLSRARHTLTLSG